MVEVVVVVEVGVEVGVVVGVGVGVGVVVEVRGCHQPPIFWQTPSSHGARRFNSCRRH